jgi:hypothetical protein
LTSLAGDRIVVVTVVITAHKRHGVVAAGWWYPIPMWDPGKRSRGKRRSIKMLRLRRSIGLASLVVLIMAAVASAGETETLQAVYDMDWQLRYYLKDDTLYGLDWQLVYYLRGDSVFDKGWIKRYYVKDRALFDLNWQRCYYIREYKAPPAPEK